MKRSATSGVFRRCEPPHTTASLASETPRWGNPSSWLTVSVNQLDHQISGQRFLSARLNRDTIVRIDEGTGRNSVGNPLVIGGVLPSESHGCDFGGRTECTITSLGKRERGVGITTRRSSSPRREAHRGRPSGSVASVPSASNV